MSTPEQIEPATPAQPRTSGQRAADSRQRMRDAARMLPVVESQLAACIAAANDAARQWAARLAEVTSQRDSAQAALGQIEHALAATVRQAVADGIRDALGASQP